MFVSCPIRVLRVSSHSSNSGSEGVGLGEGDSCGWTSGSVSSSNPTGISGAASSGGNCEVTENGKTIELNGVKIVGKSDYPSEMPTDSSKMFGSNIVNLLKIMVDKDGKLNLNFKDEIIHGTTAIHNKEYISQRILQILNL